MSGGGNMKIPYDIHDYKTIKIKNYLYVDKLNILNN